MVAIVTDAFVSIFMMRQWDGAVGASFNIAARRALNSSRESSTVQQKDDLASFRNGAVDLLPQFLTDRAESFSPSKINSHVDRGDIGQRQIQHSFFQR